MNENLMDQIFANENNIGVAVSGGLDSCCLLFLCAKYAQEKGKNLVVLHVDHCLRKESAADAKFVENLAKKYGAKFVCEKVDVKAKKSADKQTIEEAARELRYAALEKMAKKCHIQHVCLAHNANDQAETLLLHLVRGSGLKGACAMQEVAGMWVRPILHITRKELEQIAVKNNIEHVEDASNENTEYSRNYIRHNVLPQLENLQPKATEHLAGFANKMQGVFEFVEKSTPAPVAISKHEVLLSFAEPQILFASEVHSACEYFGVFKDIEAKHIDDISALFDKQNGCQIHLPHGLVAWKTAQGVVVTDKKPKIALDETDFLIGEMFFGGQVVCAQKTNDVVFGDGLYADALKIPGNAVVRTARPGDRFQKLGSKGSKKLVDYFTDKKIPQHKRANVLLVASGSDILAVLGYDIADGVKIDDETEQIVKISVKGAK